MKNYEIALFDLDGTLSESGEGILDCVKMIFRDMNRPLPDSYELSRFIGPPMYDSLRRNGFSHEDARLGVEIYKKHFSESGIYKNRVYDGLPEVLDTLRKNGVRLGVATTKYQLFADRIIKLLKIDEYFDIVGGANALAGQVPRGEQPRADKPGVMRYVIDNLRRSPSDRIVMLGDTKYDAEGAASLGCGFIGCLYGYGTREEMEEYYTIGKPVFVSTPEMITGVVLG